MTAPIVYFDVRHVERIWFPDHRLDAGKNADINGSVSGQLWQRVSEGNRRD